MNVTENQSPLINFYRSSIGKKLVTGITGLTLTLFVLVHMTGNLALFSGSSAYNRLAHFINSWGILLYLIEFILLVAIALHIAIAISIKLDSQQARPIGYSQLKSAGTPSKQSISSRTMILTGLVLLGFLIFHLTTFKFGTYYFTVINGVEMRDLSKLVIEKFQSPVYTFGYVGLMLLLSLHLRHGIWSAWQSIGVMNTRLSPIIYTLALMFALLIALGFIVLPLAIYGNLINY
jgi:succinate dehydrogenase / fumarate reductase cytochrome b subunit